MKQNINNHLSIMTILLRKCNLYCDHCSSNSSFKREGFVNTDDILNILEAFAPYAKKKQHLVSGGEPTLHPDLHYVLSASNDLGYKTSVVTNASWIDLDDMGKTERFFYDTFPEDLKITSSFDLEHFKEDPMLLQRLSVLHDLTHNRNKITIDGAYNGVNGIKKIQSYLDETTFDYMLIPMQSMGRATNLVNQNILDNNKLSCPKGDKKGFVITDDGVYYCLRTALTSNPCFKLSDSYDVEEILHALDCFNSSSINSSIVSLYDNLSPQEIIDNYHYPCDLCE
ncbi:MAG: radical SAM protein [DPANN group archaeon]|nr:radical SAM protein [DPANN group archaeon]